MLRTPVMAQSYPVQATMQLTPPYSLYLADYTAPGSNRIMVNVLLKDLTRADLQTRLKLTIEGVGVSITTKPTYRPQPLYLQGGLPVMLTPDDLAPYFNPDNLIFQGVSKNEILKGGALPEGLYRVCIEVLDYNLGAEVSNRACASAWMILNDPPIINLPSQNEKLRAQDPQNIVFQWTPRHTGSPNAAFGTEYEFELVELWPDNRNPNNAIQSTPPIYQGTTFSTTLIYGPAETPLVPGRKYAFRVKAKAMVGVDELDLFKNNGYSEVFTFTYGDACIAPKVISATTISSSRVQVTWDTEPVHTEFIVGYKKQGNDQWQEQRTYLNEVTISSLQPEATYEFRVRSICGSINGENTETVTATTSEEPVTNFTCGAGAGAYELENQDPLPELKPGDIFKAGDVEVRAFDVQGYNGNYSGIGHAEMPWLRHVKVRVEFSSIFINSDYQMLRGAVKTIFNPDSKLIVDLDGNDELSGDENSDDNADEDTDVEIDYDGEISDVHIDTETGEIIVTDEDGSQTSYPIETDEETGETKSVKVVDSSGDTWIVKDGKVTKGSDSGGPGSSGEQADPAQLDELGKIILAVAQQTIEDHQEKHTELTTGVKAAQDDVNTAVDNANRYHSFTASSAVREEDIVVSEVIVTESTYAEVVQENPAIDDYSSATSAYFQKLLEYQSNKIAWSYLKSSITEGQFAAFQQQLEGLITSDGGTIEDFLAKSEEERNIFLKASIKELQTAEVNEVLN